MPLLRDCDPYIDPSLLPRLLVGMDQWEWNIWFHVHYDARTWKKIDTGFNQLKYNITHTELMLRCTAELEARRFDVAVE